MFTGSYSFRSANASLIRSSRKTFSCGIAVLHSVFSRSSKNAWAIQPFEVMLAAERPRIAPMTARIPHPMRLSHLRPADVSSCSVACLMSIISLTPVLPPCLTSPESGSGVAALIKPRFGLAPRQVLENQRMPLRFR